MPRVTVTIITLNEAAHIADAIDSAAWADEVIVVDSGSVDETLAIARAKGARVVFALGGHEEEHGALSGRLDPGRHHLDCRQ